MFTFAEEAEPLLYFLIAFLALFGFLVGASYIGADLNSGGVVNLLLWRPRPDDGARHQAGHAARRDGAAVGARLGGVPRARSG